MQKFKQEGGQAKKDAAQAPQDGQEKAKTTRAERRAKQEAERAAKEAGAPKVLQLNKLSVLVGNLSPAVVVTKQ